MKLNKYFKWILISALISIFSFFSACQKTTNKDILNKQKLIYPKTEKVQESDYNRIIYVSKNGQDQHENGSREKPYLSIPFAEAGPECFS